MRRLILIIALLAAGAATVSIDPRWWGSSISQSVARSSEQAIPVVTDRARRADVPIYLSGLGTVQAFNSVLITSRVDGQIVKIRFEEGGDVRVGDVLVEIDWAPFEAALEGINRLKRIVPIWKKEHFADGEIWVEGEWDESVLKK